MSYVDDCHAGSLSDDDWHDTMSDEDVEERPFSLCALAETEAEAAEAEAEVCYIDVPDVTGECSVMKKTVTI